MALIKEWTIKAIITGVVGMILGWPVWVTNSLTEIKQDLALIRLNVEKLASPKELSPPVKKKAKQKSYAIIQPQSNPRPLRIDPQS